MPQRGALNRRELLASPAVLGTGPLLAQQAPALTMNTVLERAREALSPTCRVCPQCDGVACAGEFPGIGGIGTGASFQNNYQALERVKLNMRTLTDVRRPDPTVTIFGQKLSFPAIAAPIGPIVTTFGKRMPPEQYFDAVIGGCVDAGTAGALGDTPTYPVEAMQRRADIIRKYGGRSLYGIKPVPNRTLIKLLPMIEASGAFMITIDTDSAARTGSGTPPDLLVGPKTAAELRELVRATRIPIVVKGIMTPDEALQAAEAGVAGIAVSNHGGRVLDHTPGAAEVLPAIAGKVKGKLVIFADGCVHYGNDVLRYLALGADAVLVGRHLIRAAYGGGREGVALFMRTMRDQFEAAMVLTGVPAVSRIDRRMLV